MARMPSFVHSRHRHTVPDVRHGGAAPLSAFFSSPLAHSGMTKSALVNKPGHQPTSTQQPDPARTAKVEEACEGSNKVSDGAQRLRRRRVRPSCSRSSPAPTCCARGRASSTSPPTPRRSSGLPPSRACIPTVAGAPAGSKPPPGVGWCFAHTVAHDEPHALNAPFTLDRFTSGALVDERGAAAVAH